MSSSRADLSDQVALTSDIVAAYVSYNSVPTSGLADLIHTIYASLSKLGSATEAYPVVSGLSRCSSSVRTADLRGLSRWMMSQ